MYRRHISITQDTLLSLRRIREELVKITGSSKAYEDAIKFLIWQYTARKKEARAEINQARVARVLNRR